MPCIAVVPPFLQHDASWPQATPWSCGSGRWPSVWVRPWCGCWATTARSPAPPSRPNRARRSSSTLRTTVTSTPPCTGTGCGWRTSTTGYPTRPRRPSRWGASSPTGSSSPTRGCTGTTPISARTTPRSWACTTPCPAWPPGPGRHLPHQGPGGRLPPGVCGRPRLPVRLDARVTSLTWTEEGFELGTADATCRARQVVVATGPFQVPFIPPPPRGWTPPWPRSTAATRQVDLSVATRYPMLPSEWPAATCSGG
jgi:hypothetical protein